MGAFTSIASATSRSAPSAKKRRKRSSKNSRKPRRKSRKRKSPTPPRLRGKNPLKRNPKRKNRKYRGRKKNPNRHSQAAPTRLRRLRPAACCEDNVHHSSDCLDLHRGLRFAGYRKCAIATVYDCRSDPCKDLHPRWKHHRRRHGRLSRWENHGGWRWH